MNRRLKVLCVDDCPDVARSTADLLAYAGCDVRACYDELSALAAAAALRPDVCVLDLAMPGVGGIELARRLQEQAGYPLRLIALTGQWDIDSSHRTHNAGFERHLVKPADPDALVEAVTAPALAAV
jgi:CheY-like chemotaxis protein